LRVVILRASGDSETSTEKQLREELAQVTNDLEATKELHTGAQQALTATLAEVREIKRQMKLRQPRLQCLRRENELLTVATQRPGGLPPPSGEDDAPASAPEAAPMELGDDAEMRLRD